MTPTQALALQHHSDQKYGAIVEGTPYFETESSKGRFTGLPDSNTKERTYFRGYTEQTLQAELGDDWRNNLGKRMSLGEHEGYVLLSANALDMHADKVRQMTEETDHRMAKWRAEEAAKRQLGQEAKDLLAMTQEHPLDAKTVQLRIKGYMNGSPPEDVIPEYLKKQGFERVPELLAVGNAAFEFIPDGAPQEGAARTAGTHALTLEKAPLERLTAILDAPLRSFVTRLEQERVPESPILAGVPMH